MFCMFKFWGVNKIYTNIKINKYFIKSLFFLTLLFAVVIAFSGVLYASNSVIISNDTDVGIGGGSLGNDTIILTNGTYSGDNNTNIEISNNKNLIIQSQDPNNKASIDCHGAWFIENNGNLTLVNLIIKNAYRNFGGGAINNYGQLTIINCTFVNNTAHNGGVINGNCNLSIVNSSFINNTAIDAGVINSYNCNLSIVNSNFINNTAINDGGVIYSDRGDNYIINSTFTNNTAGRNGGGNCRFF